MTLANSLTSHAFDVRSSSLSWNLSFLSTSSHCFCSSSYFTPSNRPSSSGGQNLRPIQLVFKLCIEHLYRGTLLNDYFILFGEWYSVICRLCGSVFDPLIQAWIHSSPRNLSMSSKCAIACFLLIDILRALWGLSASYWWTLMRAMGSTASDQIIKGSFCSFSINFLIYATLFSS